MARQTLDNTATGQKFTAPRPAGGRDFGRSELINPYTGLPYLEANSQAFKAGDLVYLNAGAVTAITDDGTGTMECMGIALTDATNVTSGNAQIRVQPIDSKTILSMNVFDDTEADTNADNIAALVGQMYNVVMMTVTETDGTTSNCAAVDLDAQSAARVRIVGIDTDPGMPALTGANSTYIRALVKFEPYIFVTGGTTFNRNLQMDL